MNKLPTLYVATGPKGEMERLDCIPPDWAVPDSDTPERSLLVLFLKLGLVFESEIIRRFGADGVQLLHTLGDHYGWRITGTLDAEGRRYWEIDFCQRCGGDFGWKRGLAERDLEVRRVRATRSAFAEFKEAEKLAISEAANWEAHINLGKKLLAIADAEEVIRSSGSASGGGLAMELMRLGVERLKAHQENGAAQKDSAA